MAARSVVTSDEPGDGLHPGSTPCPDMTGAGVSIWQELGMWIVGEAMEYSEFIRQKSSQIIDAGFESDQRLFPSHMRDFQRAFLQWGCRRGRAALFADTGLGKTIMQLAWASQVESHTNRPVLVVAPLCVAQQTVNEGRKFGIEAKYLRCPGFSNPRIHVTNYEMLHKFDPSVYAGIVLDESSILKGMDGKMRRRITEFGRTIPYRLSCTATPSPNDFVELGTQSEFLGIMSQVEMLATFFIHDGSSTQKWRLKGHGRSRFWEWLATWAMVIRNPADLGYDSTGYDLPPPVYHSHVVETGVTDGMFAKVATGLNDRNRARRQSIKKRVAKASEIANSIDGPCIVWCQLNDESEKLAEQIGGSVQVYGSMGPETKEELIGSFTSGEIEKIITKPKIAGFGLNWQHCNQMIFVGLSDSWESFYQAIRRCWRFGQDKPVHIHIVTADTEGAVLENIRRKQSQNDQMAHEMSKVMRDYTIASIKCAAVEKTDYTPQTPINYPNW